LNYMDIRDAFFLALTERCRTDPSVVVLTADMGSMVLDALRSEIPERVINVGIAEQNMVNVAAGLALAGMRPVTYAISAFMTARCLEQIKTALCHMHLSVAIVGSGPGICYPTDGPSHHALEDYALMRALPGMTILTPSDALTATASATLAFQGGPVYIRLDKGTLPNLAASPNAPVRLILEGKDLIIISCGLMTHTALESAHSLREQGVEAGVIDVFQGWPLLGDHLLEAIGSARYLIVIEEQRPAGGLGSAVAECLADAGRMIPIRRFAIDNVAWGRHGSREWLAQQFGLDVPNVVKECLRWLR
jgi:transketolase